MGQWVLNIIEKKKEIKKEKKLTHTQHKLKQERSKTACFQA